MNITSYILPFQFIDVNNLYVLKFFTDYLTINVPSSFYDRESFVEENYHYSKKEGFSD